MGRYGTQSVVKDDRQWKIHPVWRGIGCIWLIIMPIIAFTGAKMVVQSQLLPFEADLLAQVNLPYLNYSFLPFPIDFNALVSWLPWGPLRYADLIMTGSFIFLGFGVMSVAYSFLYRFFGPPRTVFDDPRMVNVPSRRRRR